MKKYKKQILRFIDLLLIPHIFVGALVMRFVRHYGIRFFPLSKSIFDTVGVFPIKDHYYEPLFKTSELTPLDEPRNLPGIGLAVKKQRDFLKELSYSNELSSIPEEKQPDGVFYWNNGFFGKGDGEYWYNLIRAKKPKTVIEIGSGFSTLLAHKAIQQNKVEDSQYRCKHICIEPFEASWLEKLGIEIIREKVEHIKLEIFKQLGVNDILFVDSSHIIRPQGDVLRIYQEILPILDSKVIVHIHDIFTPRDYPASWIHQEVRFWNEQYLLETFLSENDTWEVLSALNYLKHSHFQEIRNVCPLLEKGMEPGSFYIQKK